MALRIGFDLDGVLADMDAALGREAQCLFGDPIERRPPSDSATARDGNGDDAPIDGAGGDDLAVPVKLDLTSGQTRALWHHVETIDDFWESLDEIEPGIVSRVGAIAAERRWEIIFLTKRPETAGATAQVQTQRWLQAKGFPLPSVYVVQGSRGRIAAALGLDIVIDDRPENCLDVVVDSRARAILVWRDDQAHLPAAAKRLGIGVVKSVGDCLDALVEMDSAPADKPGVIERVKKLLGLDESASA